MTTTRAIRWKLADLAGRAAFRLEQLASDLEPRYKYDPGIEMHHPKVELPCYAQTEAAVARLEVKGWVPVRSRLRRLGQAVHRAVFA